MPVVFLLGLLFQASMIPDATRMASELDQKARELFRSGRDDEAVRSQKRALAIWNEISRTQKIDLAAPHFNLAQMYLFQGKLSAAEQEARAARQLASELVTSTDRSRISALIAHIHFQAGEYVEAERELLAALPDLDGVEKSTALNDLGMTRAALGDFVEARRLITASLTIREQTGAAVGQDFGRVLANLALLCFRQGDLSAAASMYARAIPMIESGGELTRLDTGMALAEYSQVLKKSGRRSEARAFEQRAKDIFRASARPSLPTIDIRSLR
jgi:tetratricopeptide (TPR) repeat protein